MNKFIFQGKICSTISKLGGGVLRFKLKVSSKNGKDNTEITNYFRLVAFDNISQKLPELCEGELVEVVGFIKNVKYQKDGKNYYDYDFVIDELRKVV